MPFEPVDLRRNRLAGSGPEDPVSMSLNKSGEAGMSIRPCLPFRAAVRGGRRLRRMSQGQTASGGSSKECLRAVGATR